MNTQSNAIPESFSESRAVAPVVISEAQRLYWLVRRELWENRSIYIAPLAVAGLILFGFLISVFHLPGKMRAALALSPMQQHDLIEQPYTFAALFIMGISFIVAVFYCLDALHGERRDRSILFWKSLPVSDLTTVLSKASIPIVVIPLLSFAITVATQWVMLMVSSVVLLASGLNVAMLWRQVSLFQMSLMLLYHLLALHGFWYAPIYGWLLLVSAWVRRAVFLWAILPLVAIGVFEKIAFNTTHFAAMLSYRFMGGGESAASSTPGHASIASMTHPAPGDFLTSPGLWIGLVFAALCLAGAVRLRRYRGPI
jgi:ABC-2 type transport system permease protein